MKQLKDHGYLKDKVKEKGIKWFKKDVELKIEKGIYEKATEGQIEKVFEDITGEKLTTRVKTDKKD